MFSLQRQLFKSFFPARNFCTATTLQPALDILPFTFTADLDLVDRVDSTFQTGRSINDDLIGNKDQVAKVKNLYLKLFRGLINNNLKDLKPQTETRLSSSLEESLNYLKDNNLKIGLLGSNLLGKSDSEILKAIDVTPVGYLKVFNIDMERKNNLFIHQYKLEKKEDKLIYAENEDSKKKAMPISKKEKMQQDMIESMKVKQDRPVRDAVFWTAKKIGFLTPEDLQKETGLLEKIVNFRSNLYGRVEGEDYILVEDYEVLSPLGLYIKDTRTGEIVKSEGKDGESFRHFVRIEMKYETKDAPSIRKTKSVLLADIDFFLRGNPHTLVKNFAEC